MKMSDISHQSTGNKLLRCFWNVSISSGGGIRKFIGGNRIEVAWMKRLISGSF